MQRLSVLLIVYFAVLSLLKALCRVGAINIGIKYKETRDSKKIWTQMVLYWKHNKTHWIKLTTLTGAPDFRVQQRTCLGFPDFVGFSILFQPAKPADILIYPTKWPQLILTVLRRYGADKLARLSLNTKYYFNILEGYQWVRISHFGDTRNGTSGDRIKILSPLL